MGFLSDSELTEAICDEQIIIEPFNPEHVKTASVDFTLGRYMYRPQSVAEPGPAAVINPLDGDTIADYFGEVQYPTTAGEWSRQHKVELRGLAEADEIFVINPGEWVLVALAEIIRLSSNPAISCKMVNRSTFGRLGVDQWQETGWIEPGYYGPIGMPLINHALRPVILPVGQPIAQGLFSRGPAVTRSYGTIGRYGSIEDYMAIGSFAESAIRPKPIRRL